MDCHYFIDAVTWPNARDRMLADMVKMCPSMPFEWNVNVAPNPERANPPWRFSFSVRFAIPNRQE
jgi:hypothetical protein